MSQYCRLVLLLSLTLAFTFISHSEAAFRNEEDQPRNFDDYPLESAYDVDIPEEGQRSHRGYWKNYKETPFNSWAGKREEDVMYDIRHKRNHHGVRELADYRPYWFARDLRGSQGAKVYRPVRATFSAWGGK